MGIHYVQGDVTHPQGKGNEIIAHVSNDIGGWGKGVVLAISKRWKEPEIEFRKCYREGRDSKLGEVQFVQVEECIWVANMIGQHGIKTSSSGPPVRYEAVAECLAKVGDKARELGASVHMPRITMGLGGGTNWSKVEDLIKEHLAGLDVTIYDY